MRNFKLLTSLAVLWTIAPLADADAIMTVSSRAVFAGADLLDWAGTIPNYTGPAQTLLGDPLVVSPDSSVSVQVQQPPGNFNWSVLDDVGCCGLAGWTGNFGNGDHVLFDGAGTVEGTAPWTMIFYKPGLGRTSIDGLGFQIQAASLGVFTALLQVFDASGNLLGSFSESGKSTSAGDNSAIFIGMQDLTGANIASAQISLTSAPSSPNLFAINQLSLEPTLPSTGVPEPSGFSLAATAILALGLGSRVSRTVRRCRSVPNRVYWKTEKIARVPR